MESIGVRELRRDASRWLARVRAGETFVVTDRGRPVAHLAPLPESTGYDALVAAGRVVRGRGGSARKLVDRIDEVDVAAEEPALSEALAELRADER